MQTDHENGNQNLDFDNKIQNIKTEMKYSDKYKHTLKTSVIIETLLK